MAFHTYIEDMDETIQQYLRRTRESNKKEMIAIIRYLLEGKFDTTIARGSYCRFICVTQQTLVVIIFIFFADVSLLVEKFSIYMNRTSVASV